MICGDWICVGGFCLVLMGGNRQGSVRLGLAFGTFWGVGSFAGWELARMHSEGVAWAIVILLYIYF